MTIAAFTGAGGLGWFINLGLNSQNIGLVLLGAIPTSLLALGIDFLLGRLEHAVIPEGLQPPELIQNISKKESRHELAVIFSFDGSIRYQAISSDEVDVIDAFSIDALLEKEGLVLLEDDTGFFPPYYAVNLVRQDTLDRFPELEPILAKMDGILDEATYACIEYAGGYRRQGR